MYICLYIHTDLCMCMCVYVQYRYICLYMYVYTHTLTPIFLLSGKDYLLRVQRSVPWTTHPSREKGETWCRHFEREREILVKSRAVGPIGKLL